NVQINSRTILSTLYVYDSSDAYVDLPESGSPNPVGYLFRVDPANWRNPMLDFAYSRGSPSGRTPVGQTDESCTLNLDEQTRLDVPCIERHYTCQGSKICPNANQISLCRPHSTATRADVSARLALDRETRVTSSSPRATIFKKTAALLSAIRRAGCTSVQHHVTALSPSEQIAVDFVNAHNERIRRGYQPRTPRCEGRIVLNRDHFWMALDCSYDVLQWILEAVLEEDEDEITRIEHDAKCARYGRLVECQTVANFSSKRVVCPFDHRDAEGRLYQPQMIKTRCAVTFRMFEPVQEYRVRSPFILVTIRGLHTHPVPLPTRTPPRLRDCLFQLFEKTGADLAGLTARRFLRHPVLKSFLQEVFPRAVCPTLGDLHVSLANRAHLRSYIDQVKALFYPYGTGLQGVRHLKSLQDKDLPVEAKYIRRILELDPSTGLEYSDDEDHEHESLKIVICMSPSGSRRLAMASYLQSDIAFKRVIGYQEFELAAWDSESHQSITFCRAFVTSETAETHCRLFEEIDIIFQEDCGYELRFYHLHAPHRDFFHGLILLWIGDHHPGQAKGLGLFLQKKAQLLPVRLDLAHPSKLVSQLSLYEHLHRLFRACEIHYFRNIRQCNVTEEVRNLMRSLSCLEHTDFEGTVGEIQRLGGKSGRDWVKNKVDGDFVFQGICWERSDIHQAIWRAAPRHTNIAEIVHHDVNEEGTKCTLVNGLQKAQHYDIMKLSTLNVHEMHGIRPSYKAGHPTENTVQTLRRK
ncbi:hypothetical protein BDZ89DRAFT_904984, partial [Hymenopellis radicata]